MLRSELSISVRKIWLNKFSISNLRKKNYHGKQNYGKSHYGNVLCGFCFICYFCGWNTLEIIIMVHSLFLVGIFILPLYKRR